MNRKIITTALLATLFLAPLHAQTVSYTYRPFAAEGCKMTYSIAKQDTTFYIIATVSSDRLTFLPEPAFWIKTFKGDIIKLKGIAIGNGSETTGVILGNTVLPEKSISSSAQFHISPSQLDLFKDGIAKVRLSTTPIQHERTFRKDKIGVELYTIYQYKTVEDENF